MFVFMRVGWEERERERKRKKREAEGKSLGTEKYTERLKKKKKADLQREKRFIPVI